jgi:hypothetical protein
MNRIDQLFQQFLRERTYIQNITPATREWYETAWKAFNAPFAKVNDESERRGREEAGFRPLSESEYPGCRTEPAPAA